MNKLQSFLKLVRERADAATPGPWTSEQNDIWRGTQVPQLKTYCEGCVGRVDFYYEEDAAFVAHSRTDITKLLAIVECLSAELEWAYRHCTYSGEGHKELGDSIARAQAKADKLAEGGV